MLYGGGERPEHSPKSVLSLAIARLYGGGERPEVSLAGRIAPPPVIVKRHHAGGRPMAETPRDEGDQYLAALREEGL